MATIGNKYFNQLNDNFNGHESELTPVVFDRDYPSVNRNISRDSDSTATVTNSYSQRLSNNQFGTHTIASRFQQQTIQGMVTEAINIQGVTVKYLFRQSLDTVDELWNEHAEATWGGATNIDMYIESYDAPGGDGQVMSQYGIEFNDQITLTLSQERWAQLVLPDRPTHLRPDGGDLIAVPFGISASNEGQYLPKIFQIVDVSTFRNGAPFYQLGDNFIYRITANLFTHSSEDIDFGGDSESITQAIINASDASDVSPLFRDSDSDLYIDDRDAFADNRIIEIETAGTGNDDEIVVTDFSGSRRWDRQGAVFTSDSDLMDIGDF